MRCRFLALLLLVLPGLALGQGLSVRICADGLFGGLFGSEGCCAAEAGPSCCAEQDGAPSVVAHDGMRCEACCFDIDTSSEPSAPNLSRGSEDVKLVRALALGAAHALGALPIAAPMPRGAAHVSPAPPVSWGRSKPLPLRI